MKNFILIGENISYSFSPKLHNYIFKINKKNYNYKILNIKEENLFEILENLKNKKIFGFNITIPFKEKIIPFLDFISEEARSIGAVNCVALIDEKTFGFNTDYFGLIKTYEKMNLDLENKKVFILGSGGAAKATIKSILDLNGIPIVVSRNLETKIDNFPDVEIISYEDLKKEKGYLLINATPIGSKNSLDRSPVSLEVIKNFENILDLIYNPEKTLFLKYAESLGKNFENGLYMLVGQGIKSQKIWNDIDVNLENVYNNIKKLLAEEE